jgi:hypothetical protein
VHNVTPHTVVVASAMTSMDLAVTLYISNRLICAWLCVLKLATRCRVAPDAAVADEEFCVLVFRYILRRARWHDVLIGSEAGVRRVEL